MDSLQTVKQRYGIIGNNLGLNRALEKCIRVSNTDISVLVIGESGVGKESILKLFINILIESTINISRLIVVQYQKGLSTVSFLVMKKGLYWSEPNQGRLF